MSILMIVARLHFFRQKFRHVIEEQRRRDSKRGTGFNLSRTLSRVNPTEGMKEVKRRMSSSLRMGNKVSRLEIGMLSEHTLMRTGQGRLPDGRRTEYQHRLHARRRWLFHALICRAQVRPTLVIQEDHG